MTTEQKTMDLRATISVQAASGDGKKLPTFEIVAYTGEPLRQWWSRVPVIVNCEGVSHGEQVPLLFAHDGGRIQHVLGYITSVKTDGGKIVVAGVISAESDEANQFLAHARNGYKWQASIGARPESTSDHDTGSTYQANGRAYDGPLHAFDKCRLEEVSVLPVGENKGTETRVAAQSNSKEGNQMGDDQNGAANGGAQNNGQANTSQSGGEQGQGVQAGAQQTTQNTVTQTVTPVSRSTEQIIEAQRAENTRVQTINTALQAHIRRYPDQVEAAGQMATAAIDSKQDADSFRNDLDRLVLAAPNITTVSGRGLPEGRVIEAALAMGSGLSSEQCERDYDDQTLQAARDRYGASLGIQEALLIVAKANGYTGRDNVKAGNLRSIMEHAFPHRSVRASGGFTHTADLTIALGLVAHKVMLESFMKAEDALQQISARGRVGDFKTHKRYRLTGDFNYKLVPPSGQIESGTLDEESFEASADTYGRLFSIPRTAIINDDNDALSKIPKLLGRGAKLSMQEIGFALLLANPNNFFHADNKNLLTSNALSVTGLDAAETKFNDQVDPEGNPLGFAAAIMLVPNALHTLANQIYQGQQVFEDGNSSKTKFITKNMHAGKFRVVKSSYLNLAKIPGGSPSTWWLFAEPEDLPAIEISYLDGREEPIIESAQADFDSLGIKWRGYHDWGVDLQDPRGALKNTA
jgi:hypothetical protein